MHRCDSADHAPLLFCDRRLAFGTEAYHPIVNAELPVCIGQEVSCSVLSRLDMRFTAGMSATLRFTLYWDLLVFLFLLCLFGVLPAAVEQCSIAYRPPVGTIQHARTRHLGSFPFTSYLLPTPTPFECGPNQAIVSVYLHFTAPQPSAYI